MPEKKYVAPIGYSNAVEVYRSRTEVASTIAANRAKAQRHAREEAGTITNDIAGGMVAEGLAKMPVPQKPATGADIAAEHDMDTVMNVALAAVNTAHGVKAATRVREPSHEAVVTEQVERILNPPEAEPDEYDYDYSGSYDEPEVEYDPVAEAVDQISAERATWQADEPEEWDPWVEDDE